MAPPKSALIAAGLAGVAAVTGGTYALVQSKPEASPTPTPSPELVSPSPPGSAAQVPMVANSAKPTQPGSETTTPSSPPPETDRPTQPAEPAPVAAPAIREVEQCKVTMAKVNDPNPPTNVRSQPNTSSPDTIVGQLKNGTFVTIGETKDNWFRITTPMKGWVAKGVTVSGCNEKTERVKFGSGGTIAEITDEFIGSGSHVYRFQLGQGQTLTVRQIRGPLPAVTAPNGTVLTPMSDNQRSWSTTLPASGDYKFVLDSNYKGYRYGFTVEVR